MSIKSFGVPETIGFNTLFQTGSDTKSISLNIFMCVKDGCEIFPKQNKLYAAKLYLLKEINAQCAARGKMFEIKACQQKREKMKMV